MIMEEENKTESADTQQIPLRFRIPAGTPSKLAQQLTITNLGDVIQLGFYEIIPPLLPKGFAQENPETVREIGLIAECVARINIPRSHFASFVFAMQETLEKEFTVQTIPEEG